MGRRTDKRAWGNPGHRPDPSLRPDVQSKIARSRREFARHHGRRERSSDDYRSGEPAMTDRILAELAALRAASFTDLRAKWQLLFDGQAAPPYNRKYVEARLAYRLQELAYGSMKPETMERLDAL